jgi:hypothetical protein
MTAQVHDDPMHEAGQRPAIPAAGAGAVRQTSQPRWLLPGLAIGLVAAGLLLAGVVSLSTVVYAGLFGSMLLMHTGGHGGHGMHGGSAGHDGHRGSSNSANDLSQHSHGFQSELSGSAAGLDDRATNEPTARETDDHDQHSSHGCH